jgi:hypothetical protein
MMLAKELRNIIEGVAASDRRLDHQDLILVQSGAQQ